jgi:AhpD family alkylhydroperoxidase
LFNKEPDMSNSKESVSLCSPAVEELVAISAAIAGNCIPCLKFHTAKARTLGVGDEDMARAVAIGSAVKQVPAKEILELADVLLRGRLGEAVQSQTCCRPAAGAEPAASQVAGGAGAGPCCKKKAKA